VVPVEPIPYVHLIVVRPKPTRAQGSPDKKSTLAVKTSLGPFSRAPFGCLLQGGRTGTWYFAKTVRLNHAAAIAPDAVVSGRHCEPIRRLPRRGVIGLIVGLPGPDGQGLLIGGDPGMPDGAPPWRASCPWTGPKQCPRSRQRVNLMSQTSPRACRLLQSEIGKAVCGRSLRTRQVSWGRR
jgi:hypothetical protein